MLPNRFPDAGDDPEYNAVDASLWYVVAAGELIEPTREGTRLSPLDRQRLELVMLSVVEGLARGTRYGIRCDADGLLACGAPGVQLTWMDARVEGREVTPRIGKPVEVQALGSTLSMPPAGWRPAGQQSCAVRGNPFRRGSGTKKPDACSMSWTSITCAAVWTIPSGPTRFSRSAVSRDLS